MSRMPTSWLVVARSAVVVIGAMAAVAACGPVDDLPVGSASPSSSSPSSPSSEVAVTEGSTEPVLESELVMIDHVVLVDGEPVGDTWVTGLASDDVQLTALWGRVGLGGSPPSVDFVRDVVVYFGPAESGSCRFPPLIDVAFDPATARLFPLLREQSSAETEATCTADANPHAILVAIARAALPAGDFDIWVSDEDPPSCCVDNITRTNGDRLRTPPPITVPPPMPPTTVPVSVGCRGDLDATTAFASFVADMLTARSTGDFTPVADCLSAVPSVFDGQPPRCWDTCGGATLTFAHDPERIFAGGDVNGQAWFHSLPVSYDLGGSFVDVVENWSMRASDDGWVMSQPSIEPTFVEREPSLEVIDRYFSAIERGDWDTVASLLDDGAINLEERLDLQELAPATFTKPDIAQALAAWCSAGCDTTRPAAADLRFNGFSYTLERDGRTIRAVWFEGAYSISGLPLRSGL